MTTVAPSSTPSKYKVDEQDVLTSLLSLPKVVDAVGDQVLIRKTCVNVYGDRWRVNLWVGIDNPIVPNAGRILKSYFIKVSNLCFDVLED